MSGIISLIRDRVNTLGFDVIHYPGGVLKKRQDLLRLYDIDLIIDVGADVGNYGSQMRSLKYKNKILSFEPILSSYKHLLKKKSKDSLWFAENIALGDVNEERIFHIANNDGRSSSLREMLSAHVEAAPHAAIVRQEKVQVRRLDDLSYPVLHDAKRVFMKIDTQGYEMEVLKGSENYLQKITGVQVEMSFMPLYKDQALFFELFQYLNGHGYQLCSLENGFTNPATGQLLQCDGIFFKM